MTISIYRKNSLSKYLILRLGGGYPPPSVLKVFFGDLLKRKGAWLFFWGISKIRFKDIHLTGKIIYGED